MINSEVLRLISGNKPMVIKPTNGTEVWSKRVVYIESSFENLYSFQTPKTVSRVYELIAVATFDQMITSNDPAFFLELSQIKCFIEDYPYWLQSNGYATFFPFKARISSHQEEFELSIALVYFDGCGIFGIEALSFKHEEKWGPECGRRVILPEVFSWGI